MVCAVEYTVFIRL